MGQLLSDRGKLMWILLSWIRESVARFGLLGMRAQAEVPSALWADTPKAICLWPLRAAD
jgi:hypothetical protein